MWRILLEEKNPEQSARMHSEHSVAHIKYSRAIFSPAIF